MFCKSITQPTTFIIQQCSILFPPSPEFLFSIVSKTMSKNRLLYWNSKWLHSKWLTKVVFTCVRFWDWPWLLELQTPGWRAWETVRLPWWDQCRACSGSGHCSCTPSAQAWKCLSAPKSTDWPLRRPGSGAAHRKKDEDYYSQLKIQWR